MAVESPRTACHCAVVARPHHMGCDAEGWTNGPTVVNLKLDGIIPGNYLTQATTKSEVYHPLVDIPADPKVVEKMKALKAKKDAALKAKAEKARSVKK